MALGGRLVTRPPERLCGDLGLLTEYDCEGNNEDDQTHGNTTSYQHHLLDGGREGDGGGGGETRRAKCHIGWLWQRTNKKQRQKAGGKERRRRKRDTRTALDYKWGSNHADDPCAKLGSYAMYEIPQSLAAIKDTDQEVAELLHCEEKEIKKPSN